MFGYNFIQTIILVSILYEQRSLNTHITFFKFFIHVSLYSLISTGNLRNLFSSKTAIAIILIERKVLEL